MALIVLLTLPAPARAAQISAEYLMHVCSSDSKGKETVKGGHMTCQAYIAGVIDYNNVYRAVGAASSAADFCIPTNIQLGALQEIIYNYLRRNPQHQGFVAAPAVALALYEAFPCKRRR
ncbi:MAG: hypothetical protein EOM26_10090 [Alphaproteobacteria bacterium]|nr:hypothetical protein [Alphaproteobacteria bacterium]